LFGPCRHCLCGPRPKQPRCRTALQDGGYDFGDSAAIAHENVTDFEVKFSGKDLQGFVGQKVVVEFELAGGALLYSFGFK
jgi:hypothetical protein